MKTHKYRKAILGFVYYRKQDTTYFLVVHKASRSIIDWGFPAGGSDEGETSSETFIREMHEEINLAAEDFISVTARDDITHSYLWGEKMKTSTGYDGQKQVVVFGEILKSKQQLELGPELNGYCWLKMEDIDKVMVPEDLRELLAGKIKDAI